MTSILIPHRFPVPKSFTSITPLKFTPFGLIDHSSNTRMIYIIPPTISKGSNLIISIIWNFIQEKLKNNGKLPKTLFIQSDNAAKESKNKFVRLYWHFYQTWLKKIILKKWFSRCFQ